MKRFLVEFYSSQTPENLISILKEDYDGVFFVSFSGYEEPTKAQKSRLIHAIEKRFGYVPQFCSIPQRTILSALRFFDSLNLNFAYEFDITGGNEIFCAAAGMFVAENPDRYLYLHQYDVEKDEMLFRYPEDDEEERLQYTRHIDSTEYFYLNGSIPLLSNEYKFSYGALKREVLRLWYLVKENTREWNDFCTLPNEPDDFDASEMTRKFVGEEQNRQSYEVISSILKKAGILTNERSVTILGKRYMEFDLNVSPEAEFLYRKSGNLLEMYVAIAAEESGLFHDVRVGVFLDWDGITPSSTSAPNPRNEVDVVLMQNNIPIIGSCKNNAPKNDFLYEIMIMAEHYGGRYATPVLFSTKGASPTIRERAREMGIFLFDNIAAMDYHDLVVLIKTKFQKKP